MKTINFWQNAIKLNCFAQGDPETMHRFLEPRTHYCESGENHALQILKI